MTEISKIKVQKISLDKKLREGTQTYAKSKLEKQKEILSIKKELFKKNAEVSRLKNNTRKQDLAFHKKLIELRKNSEKSHFSKKTLKKVNSDTFEEINIDAFFTEFVSAKIICRHPNTKVCIISFGYFSFA